jgi:hypothetical protein
LLFFHELAVHVSAPLLQEQPPLLVAQLLGQPEQDVDSSVVPS